MLPSLLKTYPDNRRVALTVAGNYGEALPLFLDMIIKDKKYKDEAPRKAMISIFYLLGDTHPLAKEYRSKLTTTLY
jgi:putative thioredoxin